MSEEKNNNDRQSIDEILKEFQATKKEKTSAEPKNNGGVSLSGNEIHNEEKEAKLQKPLIVRKNQEIEKKAQSDLTALDDVTEKRKRIKKIGKKREKKEREKLDVKKTLKKYTKPLVIAALVIAVTVGAVFGINYGINASKVAYLKPYKEKYPDVSFPEGIAEKYCDAYGKNPSMTGYLKISDTGLSSPVLSKADKDNTPYAEPSEKNCEIFNYVVYLNDNSLEQLYSSADAYNSTASGFISYSDLINDYNFKVVGAFYTNTKAEDDNGYIFPYNVTEKQTADSANDFTDRLQNRFLYSTGVMITRSDTLITISCPTDFRENFRFVVVGVARDDREKLTASEKTSQIRYPQVIYDETGEENSYRFASKWYPEIIVGDTSDSKATTKILKQSVDDYK